MSETVSWGGAGLSVDARMRAGVRVCERLAAEHLDAVRRRFGAGGLGVIDLPDLGQNTIVGAQVKAGAVLYWCREVESTGLLQLLEALAESLAMGRTAMDLGGAATRLLRFWRRRDERFSATERVALYTRLFDVGEGNFEGWLAALMAQLVELGRRRRDRGVADVHARIALVAADLGQHLSDRAVGIAGFAARDILGQVRDTLSMLREPDLVLALGGGTPWTILGRWAPTLLGREVYVSRHVDRAESGLAALEWIATAAPDLRAAARRLSRGGPLVSAAERWRATGALAA